MNEILIELYKHRIELIKDVYLADWDFFSDNIDIDLNFENINNIISSESEYDKYFRLLENKIENDEFIHLKKKLTNWKLLSTIFTEHDNKSLGDLIIKVYELEKEIKRKKESLSKKIPFYLFFDTETTGLPKNWKAPVTDLNNWPRLVQLAYILYDENGNIIEDDNFIINPEGFDIPSDSSKVHGITTERAISEGINIKQVLMKFQELVDKSDYLVAHNISFDEKIIGAEYLRNGMKNFIENKNKICTMEKTTNFCKLEGPYGFKWPKLSELHFKLFDYNFEEAHDASVDIRATAKCFWELRRKNLI